MKRKWSIHPSLSVVVLYLIVTQQLYVYGLLFVSLCVHELGHIIVAKWLRVNVRKLTFLPIGGQLSFMPTTNWNMLLITTGGLFTTALFALYAYLASYDMLLFMQLIILCFNSLPIWPLDGGKLIFYSIQICIPTFRYEIWACISFINALLLLFITMLFSLPIFLQIAIGVLCVECFFVFKARKYVQAFERTSKSL